MLIKRIDKTEPRSSEITDEETYLNRRQILKAMGLTATLPLLSYASTSSEIHRTMVRDDAPTWLQEKLARTTKGDYSTGEDPAPWNIVTQYNNFYEFGTDKSDPAENSKDFVTDPWQVEIAGEAEVTGTFNLEDILKPHDLEERVYRLRCVEAWSMVVPWIGFSLGDLIKRFKPNSNAKYVKFKTLYDPEQMPGQRSRFSAIDYPYVEGLRMDEAMNPLTLMTVGLFGRSLPNQNGAPLRLVVPWKYGFKSIKSIVKLEFTRRRPKTTWEIQAPSEYGFYANVNPAVDHPRWSQKFERRLPATLFGSRSIETLPFNGYAQHVAHLYKDMNLSRHY